MKGKKILHVFFFSASGILMMNQRTKADANSCACFQKCRRWNGGILLKYVDLIWNDNLLNPNVLPVKHMNNVAAHFISTKFDIFM